MNGILFELAVICFVAFISPLIASMVPGRPIPETVFLVFIGAIIGPYGLDIISNVHSTSMELLSEIGLAFLFLMAGYEIEVPTVTGKLGRQASLTWLISLIIAVMLMLVIPFGNITSTGKIAVAIALTTTAFGTLAPILRDRKLNKTKVGDAICAFGATGELLPILAIALLLSSRDFISTLIVLLEFGLVCLLAGFLPTATKRVGQSFISWLQNNSETGGQVTVRLTVLLLIFLVSLSSIMKLDSVLGAFAAGFILRAALPQGNKNLDLKLEGIAFGFLVPIFFVISGSQIDLSAVAKNPLELFGFMLMMLTVRTLPIMVCLRRSSVTQNMTYGQQLSCALYCTMALPLIVAVTSVAVGSHAMSEDTASVLVSAGALTILIIPLITTLTIRIGVIHPIKTVQEIYDEPHHIPEILHNHIHLSREVVQDISKRRQHARQIGRWLSSTDYLAQEYFNEFDNLHCNLSDKPKNFDPAVCELKDNSRSEPN